MAVEAFAGSETITTTEWSLPRDASYSAASPQTTDVVLQLWLDLNALAAGDEFELRIYEKVQSADTQRVADSIRFVGVQGTPNGYTLAMILLHGWDATLKKIAGTDRTITWSGRRAGT